MKVSEVGEFGLIELLARELGVQYPPDRSPPPPGLLVGLGDDAVVTDRRDAATVWTTDTMVAGEHFLPERTRWEDVGWKSLASNVSDIAAMGGRPHLALVTLMLPQDACVEDILALYRGLKDCADEYGVTVAGGDIVRSRVFAITVALSGFPRTPRLGQPNLLRRDAARPGDVVAVTGTPGDSAGGLRLLVAGKTPETDDERRLVAAHERPRPRVSLAAQAVEHGLRCAIDVSDGLVQDLGHIAKASGVEVVVQAGSVPVSEALRRVWPDEALQLALSGGEDYELVVVGPRAAMEPYIASSNGEVTAIGEVVEAETPGVRVVDAQGREVELPRRGWDHFAPV